MVRLFKLPEGWEALRSIHIGDKEILLLKRNEFFFRVLIVRYESGMAMDYDFPSFYDADKFFSFTVERLNNV